MSVKVKTLSYTSESTLVRDSWAAYTKQVAAGSAVCYKDDGDPILFATLGTGDLKLVGYRWTSPNVLKSIEESRRPMSTIIEASFRPLFWDNELYRNVKWEKVRGVLIYAHGITENARTGLIRCAASDIFPDGGAYFTDKLSEEQQQKFMQAADESKCCLKFDGSWVDMLVKNNYVVYALDQQSHGYSEGWKGERCNVQRLIHLSTDFLELIRSLVLSGEVPNYVPKFVAGASLGGCITSRAIQEGFKNKLITTPHKLSNSIPTINGWILFCPAISTEKLKRIWPNVILLPLSNILSRILPSFKAATLDQNFPYAFIQQVVTKDPQIYNAKLPVRISAESVVEMERIQTNLHYIDPELQLLIVQSKYDTMTDPEGSQAMLDLIPCVDKSAEWLNYSWHWLSKEPGYGTTISYALKWMNERTQ